MSNKSINVELNIIVRDPALNGSDKIGKSEGIVRQFPNVEKIALILLKELFNVWLKCAMKIEDTSTD